MKKKDGAYKTIGEVAKMVGLVDKKKGTLSTHTLRFWEKNFKQIKPKIFSGRRRYYDDKSIEIISSFKDKRIKIFKSKKYLKLYEARNEAIKKAQGKYICFLDTDDWWTPKKIEIQLKALVKNDKFLDSYLGEIYRD